MGVWLKEIYGYHSLSESHIVMEMLKCFDARQIIFAYFSWEWGGQKLDKC